MTFISLQSRVRAGPGRRRKRRRRKKRGAYGLESAHLDGAGSTGGFSFAPASAIPAAFFVAPRYAPRISQPSPGAPCPERDLQGGTPPRRHRTFSGEISPCLRWAPHLHPPPQQPLRAYGTLKQKKGGCRAPFPQLAPPPPGSCYVVPPGISVPRVVPVAPSGLWPQAGARVPEGCPSPRQGLAGLDLTIVRWHAWKLIFYPTSPVETAIPAVPAAGALPRGAAAARRARPRLTSAVKPALAPVPPTPSPQYIAFSPLPLKIQNSLFRCCFHCLFSDSFRGENYIIRHPSRRLSEGNVASFSKMRVARQIVRKGAIARKALPAPEKSFQSVNVASQY